MMTMVVTHFDVVVAGKYFTYLYDGWPSFVTNYLAVLADQ